MEILVRRALPRDYPWVQRLAVESSVYGIPYGRDIPNRAVMAAVRQELRDFPARVGDDPSSTLLVACAADTGERLGYLILRLDDVGPATGERQSFIHDLAVAPAHWGRKVGHRLVEEAAKATAAAGLRYMTAEVTADNQRTVATALRLGFSIERYQMVMACDADGPALMPGRPDAEKAHLQSRIKPRSEQRRDRTLTRPED